MSNATVLIYVESRYKVSRKRIKSVIAKVLEENKITSPTEVSIAIVGDRKMRTLNNTYRGKDTTTNVLSFSQQEGEGTFVPTDVLRLGDVVLSYPQVIRDAARDEVMVDDKVDELIAHGLLHLLGLHHD